MPGNMFIPPPQRQHNPMFGLLSQLALMKVQRDWSMEERKLALDAKKTETDEERDITLATKGWTKVPNETYDPATMTAMPEGVQKLGNSLYRKEKPRTDILDVGDGQKVILVEKDGKTVALPFYPKKEDKAGPKYTELPPINLGGKTVFRQQDETSGRVLYNVINPVQPKGIGGGGATGTPSLQLRTRVEDRDGVPYKQEFTFNPKTSEEKITKDWYKAPKGFNLMESLLGQGAAPMPGGMLPAPEGVSPEDWKFYLESTQKAK